jgi:8-oxo-dGTP diphosphatase
MIHVAVGLLLRSDQVLIALRPKQSHQGGLWEFPGGKIESGETHMQALARELKEEVDVQIDQQACELFKAVHHDYSDKQVSLYFYLVKDFSGTAKGLEGQPVMWVNAQTLPQMAIPDANQAIADALLQAWPVN